MSAPRARPTIRDVAALSGTSLKSVSRVVNGESGVSPELAARVQSAIDQLGYRHNLGASSLRRSGQRTSSIGVLLQDVSNPFSGALHRSIELLARERGVAVLAASVDGDPARERLLIGELAKRRVDGIIVMPSENDHSYLLDERRVGTQFVFVDRVPMFLDADSVVADNSGGSSVGVSHMLAGGHQRIAYMGDSLSISTASERYSGYVAALTAAGVALDERLIVSELRDEHSSREAFLALLDLADPPTAVFTAQNIITIGVLHALRARNQRSRIAHVGFDDVPLGDLLDPGVSVVAQDPVLIGTTAAARLFARIDGDRSPTAHVVTPVRLVERGSGELRFVESSV
jgi:LacI family transcriptional regulator